MRRNRLGWAAWLLAAAALYFFENNAGTRALLAASVLLPTLSLVCAALSARRTGCALAMPAAIEKGETALLRCRVVGSRLLPGCVLDGALAVENPLTGERWEEPLAASGDGAAADIAPVTGPEKTCLSSCDSAISLIEFQESLISPVDRNRCAPVV